MRWNTDLPTAEWYEPGDSRLSLLIQNVEAAPLVAIDTETTGLTTWKDMPLFWSLSFNDRRICMPAETLPLFRTAFQDKTKQWVLANAKYDMHILANYGTPILGSVIDTQVMHALIYEEQSHALKDMAMHVLGWKWLDFGDTFSFGKGGRLNVNSSAQDVAAGGRFETVQDAIMWCYFNDRSKLVEYAANDAYGTMKVYEALKVALENEPAFSLYNDQFQLPFRPGRLTLNINNQWDYFKQIEQPFTRVLFECERNGILVDQQYLGDLSKKLVQEIEQCERRANQIAGRRFNLNSTDQLRDYLINTCGLRALKKTKGGSSGVKKDSVDAAFLEFHEDNEMAALALRYRRLTKLNGTYVRALPTHADPHGRIHCRFNQDVARTGRLSSSDPNMQNIPNAERDVHKIRKAFIAPDGKVIICYDYDQLEMRLLGAASLEPSMIKTFESGRDIHMANAELVYGLPYDDIKMAKKMSDQDLAALERSDPKRAEYIRYCVWARGAVKTVGFGLNYGMQEKLLANKIKTTVDKAIEIRERYLASLPGVSAFYKEAIEECRRTGYSYTLCGRRRFLPEIISQRSGERGKAERQAVNNAIQGTAADGAKLAMINCFDAGLDKAYGCLMLLQVHDEIVFECPKETAAMASAEIKDLMTDPFPSLLAVSLTASGGIGDNWCEAKG